MSNSQRVSFGLGAEIHQNLLTVSDDDSVEPVGATVALVEGEPMASIVGYSPSNVASVGTGVSVNISVTFRNTGVVPWNFIVGAAGWNSSGQQVANYSSAIGFDLQPQQQHTDG